MIKLTQCIHCTTQNFFFICFNLKMFIQSVHKHTHFWLISLIECPEFLKKFYYIRENNLKQHMELRKMKIIITCCCFSWTKCYSKVCDLISIVKLCEFIVKLCEFNTFPQLPESGLTMSMIIFPHMLFLNKLKVMLTDYCC